MKKALLLTLVLLVGFSLSSVFAGGAEEEVLDVEAVQGPQTVEGVVDIDYSGWERGRKGGRFIRAALSDPRTFNGVVAAETSTTDVTDLLESGAIRRNQMNLEFEPAMAERYEVSDDEMSITVYLQRDLQFSDGEPITAQDFVFTMNHLILREDIGSNSRSGYFIAPAPGEPQEPALIELIDDYTYRLTLPTVYAGLVSLAGIVPYPQHIFADVIGWDESVGYEYEWEFTTDEDGNRVVSEIKPEGVDYAAVTSFWGVDTDVTEVVSSGPFVIEDYAPGERIVLGPNPNYWETDEWGTQLPYLDEVVMRIIPDQDTQLQAFLAGEIDTLRM